VCVYHFYFRVVTFSFFFKLYAFILLTSTLVPGIQLVCCMDVWNMGRTYRPNKVRIGTNGEDE